MNNKANIYWGIVRNIGYADTMHGIKTFPANGTDCAATLQDWAVLMLKACEQCQDPAYAQGVREALATIQPNS